MRVVVVDVGVAGELPTADGLWPYRVRPGTCDLTAGPAMTRDEAVAGIEAGIAVADRLVEEGADCLLTGDMGIANTTASAALIAAFTGADPATVTGRGTGVDDPTLLRKVAAVRAGLARNAVDQAVAAADPVAVLAAVGGLEQAALAGFVLAAAAHRVPVILDGVIAGAAALVAQAIAPAAVDACIAGHRSAEPGHAHALRALGLRPLIELDLRLGRGHRRGSRTAPGPGRGGGAARHGDLRRRRRGREDRGRSWAGRQRQLRRCRPLLERVPEVVPERVITHAETA